MIFPEIVNFLLTLRYPSSEVGRMNWVCYRGMVLITVPLVPPGRTVAYTISPQHGHYAWLGYSTKIGSDIVPNAFTGIIQQYGTIPYSGVVSQALRDNEFEGFFVMTEQEPAYFSMTNISPLAQRGEVLGSYIIIPSPQDMVTVLDALRRLHTSTESEHLLQQIADLLGILTGRTSGGGAA